METLKNVLSIGSAVAPLIEKVARLLPVNPVVREDVLLISTAAAGLAGLGGYQSGKRFGWIIGWTGVCLFVVCVVLEVAITSAGFAFGLDAAGVSLAVRTGYIAIFLFFGLAVGGFISRA